MAPCTIQPQIDCDSLRRYALDAGFRDVEVLPIEHFFFRFYRLYQ